MESFHYYIATKLDNRELAVSLEAHLQQKGGIPTFDWWARPPVDPEDLHALAKRGRNDFDGVLNADVVFVLLPGGIGTHVELGAALAMNKPLHIVGEQGGDYPCVFHTLARSEGAMRWSSVYGLIQNLSFSVDARAGVVNERWRLPGGGGAGRSYPRCARWVEKEPTAAQEALRSLTALTVAYKNIQGVADRVAHVVKAIQGDYRHHRRFEVELGFQSLASLLDGEVADDVKVLGEVLLADIDRRGEERAQSSATQGTQGMDADDPDPAFTGGLASAADVRFQDDVASEVIRARQKFPTNAHKLGALMEEVGELAKALLEEEPRERIWAEAMQVAAMAQRIAVGGDLDYPKSVPKKALEAAMEAGKASALDEHTVGKAVSIGIPAELRAELAGIDLQWSERVRLVPRPSNTWTVEVLDVRVSTYKEYADALRAALKACDVLGRLSCKGFSVEPSQRSMPNPTPFEVWKVGSFKGSRLCRWEDVAEIAHRGSVWPGGAR